MSKTNTNDPKMLSESETKMFQDLRGRGFASVVFTPYEICDDENGEKISIDADELIDILEYRLSELAWEIIDSYKIYDEDE